jgi:hypothetical protein
MGGRKMITYTLQSECGSSLRGAGWVNTKEVNSTGQGWLSRDREHQAVFDEPKYRWEVEA